MTQRLNYLGKHTCVPHLQPKHYRQISYLKDNNGALPPFILNMGDARRLELACQVLELTNIVRLHQKTEKLIGLKGRGRVDVILGTYTHKTKSIPLLLVETQMGMPATEIILREILAHASNEYCFQGKKIVTDGINLIRVGTAGGVNTFDEEKPFIRVGDMINVTFSIGWAGTLLEALGGTNYASPDVVRRFSNRWELMGYDFTNDGRFPRAPSAETLVNAVDKAGRELRINVHRGSNFSKDSLYAELNDHAFVELREKYNVMSTEMEQMAVAKVVGDFRHDGIKVNAGLVSGVIGVIPGSSFAEKYDHVEKNAVKVAGRAMWNNCYQR
jgi:uridine phosphorylase